MHSNARHAEFVGTPLEYFELLAPAFQAAATAPVDGWYRFGPRTVRIRFASQTLETLLGPAISHLRTEADSCPDPARADLTLHVWDGDICQADPLPAPRSEYAAQAHQGTAQAHQGTAQAHQGTAQAHQGTAQAHSGTDPVEHCDYGLVNDRYQFCFAHSRDGARYSFVDHQSQSAFFWMSSGQQLPAYERAAPFRLILHWWLRSSDCHLIHAGAIGTDEGGVLIGGRGGSGKSTTCLTCATAGMLYASDDYVAVSSKPEPVAYSLYRSVKLDNDSLQRFPSLAPRIVNPQWQEPDKAIAFLSGETEELVGRLPLRAIVLPTIAAVSEPRLTPARAIHALQGLGPSTMMQMPGTSGAEMGVIASLARCLPAYRLELAPEMAEVPALLSDLISQLNREPSGGVVE